MNQQPVKKKRSRKWLWIALAAAAAVLVLAVMIGGMNTARTSMNEAQAARRDLVTYYSFSGNLTPIYDEVQNAKDAVKVKELYVAEGDRIKEDQPLLRCTDGSRIYAAHEGVVDKLYVENDDQLQPGSQLARIVDYDHLEVSVNVDEYDIGAVTLGKKGDVYLNALDKTVPCEVTEIARSATIEGGISYFAVKLEIAAQEGVRSGMSVEVSLLNQQAIGAVTLPLTAISYDEYNKPYVLVKDDGGKYAPVSVGLGVSDGLNTEILSGVADGQTVYYQSNNMARFYAMRESMMSQGMQ